MHEYSLTIVLFLSFSPPLSLNPPPPFFSCSLFHLPTASLIISPQRSPRSPFCSGGTQGERSPPVVVVFGPAVGEGGGGRPEVATCLQHLHWPPLPQGHKAIRFLTLITCTCDLCTVTRTNAEHVASEREQLNLLCLSRTTIVYTT